jgi:hypothetical protein
VPGTGGDGDDGGDQPEGEGGEQSGTSGDGDSRPDAERAQRLENALRLVTLEAADRAVKRAVNAARRAAARGRGQLTEWLQHAKEGQVVGEILQAGVAARAAAAGAADVEPAWVARVSSAVGEDFAGRLAADLTAALVQAEGAPDERLEELVGMIADRWELEMPGVLAGMVAERVGEGSAQ